MRDRDDYRRTRSEIRRSGTAALLIRLFNFWLSEEELAKPAVSNIAMGTGAIDATVLMNSVIRIAK